jgi:hypothetical protein
MEDERALEDVGDIEALASHRHSFMLLADLDQDVPPDVEHGIRAEPGLALLGTGLMADWVVLFYPVWVDALISTHTKWKRTDWVNSVVDPGFILSSRPS